jgi:hypothetical protein
MWQLAARGSGILVIHGATTTEEEAATQRAAAVDFGSDDINDARE